MKSGVAHTVTVPLDQGFPDGAVSWVLVGVASGTVTPSVGAVSINIQITPLNNTLGVGEMLGFRELQWSYAVSAIAISGYARWTLEGSIPFGVSEAGVRKKLGIDTEADLSDADINLIHAYLNLQNDVGASALTAQETGTSFNKLTVIDAIEALAALELLPTMQIRVAKSENSGTNAYTRQNIDWQILADNLNNYVSKATDLLAPVTETAGDTLFLTTTSNQGTLFPDG